ncbi:MAG TPA: hypothetical protein DIV47_01465 [Candidatus Pacebacteria bacterium]|nr:hypothetical protein [Candidatus Paceibacterota bacterium]
MSLFGLVEFNAPDLKGGIKQTSSEEKTMIYHILFTAFLVGLVLYVTYYLVGKTYKSSRQKSLGEWLVALLVLAGFGYSCWDVWLRSIRFFGAPWGYALDVFWAMTAVGILLGVSFFREILRQKPHSDE